MTSYSCTSVLWHVLHKTYFSVSNPFGLHLEAAQKQCGWTLKPEMSSVDLNVTLYHLGDDLMPEMWVRVQHRELY